MSNQEQDYIQLGTPVYCAEGCCRWEGQGFELQSVIGTENEDVLVCPRCCSNNIHIDQNRECE